MFLKEQEFGGIEVHATNTYYEHRQLSIARSIGSRFFFECERKALVDDRGKTKPHGAPEKGCNFTFTFFVSVSCTLICFLNNFEFGVALSLSVNDGKCFESRGRTASRTR